MIEISERVELFSQHVYKKKTAMNIGFSLRTVQNCTSYELQFGTILYSLVELYHPVLNVVVPNYWILDFI